MIKEQKLLIVAKNLINGNITELKNYNSYIKFISNFEKRECLMKGKHTGKCLVSPYDDTIKVDNINNNYKECTIMSIEYDFKNQVLYLSLFLIRIIELYIHKKIFL